MKLWDFEKRGWSIQEPVPLKSTLFFWGNHIVLKIHEDQLTKEYILPGVVRLMSDKVEGISLSFGGYYLIKNNHWLPFIHYSELGE